MLVWAYYNATARWYTRDVLDTCAKGSLDKEETNIAYIPAYFYFCLKCSFFRFAQFFCRKNESCGRQISPQVNLFIFILYGVWDGILFQDYLPIENIKPDQVSHLPRNTRQRRRRERCVCLSKHP
jgi:hypothetical protein